MTVDIISWSISPRKYGTGPGSNSRPLDLQSDTYQIVPNYWTGPKNGQLAHLFFSFYVDKGCLENRLQHVDHSTHWYMKHLVRFIGVCSIVCWRFENNVDTAWAEPEGWTGGENSLNSASKDHWMKHAKTERGPIEYLIIFNKMNTNVPNWHPETGSEASNGAEWADEAWKLENETIQERAKLVELTNVAIFRSRPQFRTSMYIIVTVLVLQSSYSVGELRRTDESLLKRIWSTLGSWKPTWHD